MVAGTDDELSDIDDVKWLKEIISEKVVHYTEIEAGQATFMVGLDMTYLEDLVKLLDDYNPATKPLSEEEQYLEGVIEKYKDADDSEVVY